MDSKTKEYFERFLTYEDKENMYHPDQIDKNSDIDFIKMAYRLQHSMIDFHTKNMAANYLSKGVKVKVKDKDHD